MNQGGTVSGPATIPFYLSMGVNVVSFGYVATLFLRPFHGNRMTPVLTCRPTDKCGSLQTIANIYLSVCFFLP